MANNLFRDLTSILRGYFDPFFAETLTYEMCERCATSEDEISANHLPQFMLAIATHQKLLDKLKAHEFSEMMKKFMTLSNRLENMDRRRMRTLVNGYNAQSIKEQCE